MKVKVTVKSGKGLKNVERITGVSDPYVQVLLDGKEQFQTAVIEDTLVPVWDHKADLEWDEKSSLKFVAWDKNKLTIDKAMGEATLTEEQITNSFVGTLELSEGGSIDITVQTEVFLLASANNEVVGAVRKADHMLKRMPSVSWEDITESDILMWRKKSKAGVILGGVDLVFVVHFFYGFDLLTLIGNLGISAIFLGAMLKFAGVPIALAQYELFPASSIPRISKSIAALLDHIAAHIQQMIFGDRVRDSVKIVCCLYALKLLSRWLSVAVFAFLVFNALFVLPISYKKNQGLLKQTLEPKYILVKTMVHDLLEKVPKHTDVKKDD